MDSRGSLGDIVSRCNCIVLYFTVSSSCGKEYLQLSPIIYRPQRDGTRTPYNGKIGVTPLLKHLVKVYDIRISKLCSFEIAPVSRSSEQKFTT